jgi:spore coat protein U-like protein
MRRFLIAAFILAAAALPARAQSCSFSTPGITFGTVDLTPGIAYSAASNLTVSCSGTPGETVRVCPNINAGTGGSDASGDVRYMLNGADRLQFNLFSNSSYTQVWGSDAWGLPPAPPTIDVTLNGSGNGALNRPLRGRIFSGQQSVPNGAYSSVFAGAETRFNYAYSSSGNCAAISSLNLNQTEVPFSVTATAGGSCAVSATELDFGSTTFLDSNMDADNTISVRCPPGTGYTIGLDGGLSGASDPTARQLDSGTNTITYGIYRDAARTQPWGTTIGGNTIPGTGSGNFQDYTAYGRIPQQTTPPPGVFADTIVVTVTY